MNNDSVTIGIVGVGLMGSSIAADLLMNGQRVVALSPVESLADGQARERVEHQLVQCYEQGLVAKEASVYLSQLQLTQDYPDLRDCQLVIESVVEKEDVKREVLERVEAVVSQEAIITSNTSAIPINTLQQYVGQPERFFGMHWAEPAYTTRFLEIICGDQSSMEVGERLYRMAEGWGKEPTLLRKDIRGFVTNRLMYALYREACYLVENGYATMEDVDRSCKNDAGHWMTFCGPFRYMDLTGVQAYYHVMQDLLPTLSNQTDTPSLIKKATDDGGNGTSNGRGFYQYTESEARQWAADFRAFSFDIARLSAKYHAKSSEKKKE